MENDPKKIYTNLSIEELVWNLKVVIVAINSGEVPDLRSVASKLENLVGQRFSAEDGTWCPPNCNGAVGMKVDGSLMGPKKVD